jgi:hypothetical protein
MNFKLQGGQAIIYNRQSYNVTETFYRCLILYVNASAQKMIFFLGYFQLTKFMILLSAKSKLSMFFLITQAIRMLLLYMMTNG